MAAKQKEYVRLPGRGYRRQGVVSVTARRSRLWLGADHLLLLETQWYTEEYKRFYFRDIQAITIRKTDNGKYINLVWMSLAIPTLAGVIFSSGGWQVFWIIVTAIFGGFLLLNALYGPTSVCHLRTAVQTEELPSLKRLRRARKVLARLRPLIAEAQGQFSPGEIAGRMAEMGSGIQPVGDYSAPSAEPATSQSSPAEPAPPGAT
jgi:hypothetical protein